MITLTLFGLLWGAILGGGLKAVPGWATPWPGAATHLIGKKRLSTNQNRKRVLVGAFPEVLEMDAQVLNFKAYSSGALCGFFDLEVDGLTFLGCKCFVKGNSLWFQFPSIKSTDASGEVRYTPIVTATTHDSQFKHFV